MYIKGARRITTKTLEEWQGPLELGAAGQAPVKKHPGTIKKIGATLTQLKNSAPANAITDKGSYMPWAAQHLYSEDRLKVLMFGRRLWNGRILQSKKSCQSMFSLTR